MDFFCLFSPYLIRLEISSWKRQCEKPTQYEKKPVWSHQAWLFPVLWNVFLMRGDIISSRKGLNFFSFVDAPISDYRERYRKIKRPSPTARLQRDQQKLPSIANIHLLAFDVARTDIEVETRGTDLRSVILSKQTMAYFLLVFFLCNALISVCRACSCLPSHPQNEYCNSAFGEYASFLNIT